MSLRGLDRVEWALLGALGALAFAPLAGLLLRVATEGGTPAGGDGFLVLDQMQYLNWIRQAGEHLLVENLYDLRPGPRSFLHPGIALGGVIAALGVGPATVFFLFKPLAVVALWAGAVSWCRRFLAEREARWAAVAVALLFASPVAALVGWSGLGGTATRLDFDFLSGELTPGNYLWGYPFTAIAVGVMPLALLAWERGAWGWAAATGCLVSWLQPWQGATLLLVLLGAEAWLWRSRGRPPAWGRLVAMAAATTAPLAYYAVLSVTDSSWELAGEANDFEIWPWWVTVLGLAILVVPALTAPRPAADSFGALALRLWPPAALAVFIQPFGTFPAHALQGLVLPLVVLAFLGAAARLRGATLIVLVALLCVPGTVYRADELRGAVQAGHQPFFLEDGEVDALRFLERAPTPGGVLAPIYTGLLVPAWTGRETWVGAGSWTPDFDARVQRAERLFAGEMSAAQAARMVRASGARFVLSDCHGRAEIEPLLRTVAGPARRLGCARVWEVRP